MAYIDDTLGQFNLVSGVQAQEEECGFESRTEPNGDEILVWTCGDSWAGGDGDGEQVCTTNLLGGQQVRVPCVDPVLGWFTASRGGCYIPAGGAAAGGRRPGLGWPRPV